MPTGSDEIWVTGMGAIGATGQGVANLWDGVSQGKVSGQWKTLEPPALLERLAVCSAPAIPIPRPVPKGWPKWDRCVQMAWMAAREAWMQARLDQSPVSPERIGCIIGSSRGPIEKMLEGADWLDKRRVPPSLAAFSTIACISGTVAQAFHIHGPCFTLSAACASAAFAIANAAQHLILGEADVILAGGTEAALHPAIIRQLQATGVLASHANPSQACRPFDKDRSGLVLGEGAGFLVLETAASARKRDIRPLARLAGWATGSDAGGRVGMTSEGEGLFHVMHKALAKARLRPEQIDYINAHGTGTQLNDSAEAGAIYRLFSQAGTNPPVSSTKPVTGHCVGATPGLEAIIAIESMRNNWIPQTANCQEPDPDCRVNIIRGAGQKRDLEYVLSNSAGFWAKQAALVFAG